MGFLCCSGSWVPHMALYINMVGGKSDRVVGKNCKEDSSRKARRGTHMEISLKSRKFLKQQEGERELYINNRDEDESESNFPNICCIGRKIWPGRAMDMKEKRGRKRGRECGRQSTEIQQENSCLYSSPQGGNECQPLGSLSSACTLH